METNLMVSCSLGCSLSITHDVMIYYIKFLDHVSTSNAWETVEEFNKNKLEICEVVGFFEKEDNDAIYLSTMKSKTDLGSGHIIIKSAIISLKKIPLDRRRVSS